MPDGVEAGGGDAAVARVARLTLYPVKSLDGQRVETATVLPSGALDHDRVYALHDADGRILNAKRQPALQRLRTRVDLAAGILSLGEAGERTFDLASERDAFEAEIGAAVGTPVHLRDNRVTGFPDDLASPGPTVVSTATLMEVAGWFALTLDDMRARLRANVEVDGVPPFWEDRLFGGREDETVAFRAGPVALLGVNPCLRCAVPTRDPRTGAPDPDFAARFTERREHTLPDWAPRGRFRPFYRVAVNTRRDRASARDRAALRVGDAVSLV